MIRLFRKIRNQLLFEDQYITYFLYALGEIILVMIGILLALQVNNWNEHRKEKAAGEELTVKLYKDLLTNYDDSKNAYQAIDRQIRYIDLLLTQGKNLNIDSLLSVTEEEYRFVKVFTFPIYILYFTEYYTPNLQVFESSRNDGSLKLVQDEELINALEYIYIDASSRMKMLDDREIASNENIEEYIAANYSHLFEANITYRDGL